MLKWLFVTRKQYDELDQRLRDVERHFVTKRDVSGNAIETLADVPLAERKKKVHPIRGMNWNQQKRFLEQTDGGRNV